MSTAARNRFRFSRFPPTADEFAFQLFFVFFTRCIMFKTGRHGTAESGAEVSDMTTYTTE